MKVITRPGFIVKGTNGVGYNANDLRYCTYKGYWHLSFICSGGMMLIPVAEVASVEFVLVDTHHCNECDQPLSSWPMEEGYPYVKDVEPAI